MKREVYRHGGAKYNFDINDEGKYILVSLIIFGKEFEFPNGGITEKSIEEIADNVRQEIIETDNNGEIDRLDEIKAFLRGYPEGTTLEEILASLDDDSVSHLTDEEIASWFRNDNDKKSSD